MTIWIDDSTKLRVNIHAPYKGFSRLDTPEVRLAANVVKVASPLPPVPTEGFTLEEEYYRTEQTSSPYVVWTKKSEDQLAEITSRKVKAGNREKAKEENKENATTKYLISHNAAQIKNHIDTSITDLDSAKTMIARLAIAIGVLLRENDED